MKIHSIVDCITNSSSTTFIVGFEKKPKTIGEMYDILFPAEDLFVTYYDYTESALRVAATVFDDLEDAKKIQNVEELIEEYAGGGFEGCQYFDVYNSLEMKELYRQFVQEHGPEAYMFDYPDWNDKYLDIVKQKAEEERISINQNAETIAKKHWKIFKKLHTFVLEYGDEDGSYGALMEHGDIFRNIYHQKISNH